jgi:hypothetical protein
MAPKKRLAKKGVKKPVASKRRVKNPAPRTAKKAPPVSPISTVDLDREIFANPNDPAPFLVLGDQLQAAGDPQGDLIALQNARRARPKDAKLAKQEAALIKKLRAPLLGELASVVVTKIGKTEQPSIDWFMGFVRSIKLDASPGHTLASALPHLCERPALRFLQEIRFGEPEADTDASYDEVFDRLATIALPKTLRSMFFGNYWDEGERYITLGEIPRLYPAVPALQRLRLRGSYNNGLDLGTLDLPELRELIIQTDFADEAMLLGQISNGRARKLTSLELDFGPERGATLTVDVLRDLLVAQPHLTSLSLEWVDAEVDVVGAIVESKIAATLEHLALRACHLADAAIEPLVANRKRFGALASLDLEHNHLTPAGMKRLKGFCKRIELAGQYDPDDF